MTFLLMSNTPNQVNHVLSSISREEENIIQEFSDLISSRMADGCNKEYSNWQDPNVLPDKQIIALINKAFNEGDWSSVGVFAMMANQRNMKTPSEITERVAKYVPSRDYVDRQTSGGLCNAAK